jgi:hypothetical protein
MHIHTSLLRNNNGKGIFYNIYRIWSWARGVVWIILLAFGADDPGSNPGGPVRTFI